MSSNQPRSGKQKVGFLVGFLSVASIALDLPFGIIGLAVGLAVAVGVGNGISEVIGKLERKGHGNPLKDISNVTSEAVQKAAEAIGKNVMNGSSQAVQRAADFLDRNLSPDQRVTVNNPSDEVLSKAEQIRRQQEMAHQQEAVRRAQETAEREKQERIQLEKARKEAEARKADEALPLSGDEKADAVIKQGREMLRKIRSANESIPEERLTSQMNQLEYLCTQMFRTVSEKPAKADHLRKFLSYYLPTTLKMLDNYSTMRRRGVSKADLDNARETMERGMEMILTAAQKQLDSLYKSDMLDVSTDIDVLEQMLKRDGFVDGGLGNIPTGTQSQPAPAVEKPASSAAASRMGSATIPTIQVEGQEEDHSDEYRTYFQQRNSK